jgi:Ca2+-binding EF-hand superfamily protein
VISQEFINTDNDDAIVASLEDRLKKHMAKLEAVKALAQTIQARFEKYTENQAFGPFSSMALETMPTPGEMWDIMQKASKGSKIGSQMFTSFLHWMCVKTLAKTLSEMKPDGLIPGLPGLPGLPEDEMGNFVSMTPEGTALKIPKKDIFELFVDMVDSIVVSLAPDLFRCIDTNNDGDMSKEEWEALVEVLKAPQPEKVMDFSFTIMDKDGSKTLEVDEVSAFITKILKIVLEVARSAVHICGRIVIQSSQQIVSDQLFEQLDRDKDGCVTPDEMFMDFPPQLLEAVR